MKFYDTTEFITREEYYETRDDRLHPNELIVDELYTILFSFKRHPTLRGKEAIKYPILCAKPSFEDMGRWIINFNLLDRDLTPSHLMLWEKFKPDNFIDIASSNQHRNDPFSEGYLKPFDDGLSVEAPMLIIEQGLES